MQYDLFTPHGENPQPIAAEQQMPLAARMRPESLDEVAGQQHLLAEGKLLRRAIETDRFSLPALHLRGCPADTGR